jgi:hypothetical protein
MPGVSPAAGQRTAVAIRTTAGFALLALVGVVVWQVLDGDGPDATTLGLLVLTIVSVVALLEPRPFAAGLSRIKSLDVLGVKVELEVERVRNIARRFPIEEDDVRIDEPRPRRDTPAAEVDEVSEVLRARIRFVRDAVLDDPDALGEDVVVAHLEYLAILGRDEAHLCHEVMGDLRVTIADWDASEREKFLDQGWTFAKRFASQMFDRYARRRLRDAGWFVADFAQGARHRADFLAMRDGEWALVAARVASSKKVIDTAIGRLGRADCPVPGARRIMVIPDHVDLPTEIGEGDRTHAEQTVSMLRLRRLIERPR